MSAITLLLVALFLYFGVLEAAMRVLLPRVSAGQQREGEDYRNTLSLRATTLSGSTTVLIVGNSLLLAGVDRQLLAGEMAPDFAVSMFPIEATTYLDWYFGLRRYFAEGSRPAVVVLCINSRQLLSNATNGSGFAYSMMQASDIVRVMNTAKLDTMVTSNYFFAHWSAWLGRREYFRNGLMEKFIPDAKLLAAHFSQRDPLPLLPSLDVVGRAVARLQDLQDLSNVYGSKFVFLVPPSANPADPAPAILTAAERAGIAVVLPFQPAELPGSAFADGLHLNSEGERQFTERVGPVLVRFLAGN